MQSAGFLNKLKLQLPCQKSCKPHTLSLDLHHQLSIDISEVNRRGKRMRWSEVGLYWEACWHTSTLSVMDGG